MSELRYERTDKTLTVFLEGPVSAANAGEIEKSLNELLRAAPLEHLTVDCEKLDYIASAGLRILLRLKKTVADMELVNVSPDVYEIFEMTGFTEMIRIRKAYRVISVKDCTVIGHGANGTVCRLNPEIVVKIYKNPDALPDITRERELARTAFILGIPTAIPYDVVRIREGGYGSVFELLNAESFADVLIRGEKTVEEAARMSVEVLKLIHSTVPKDGSVPSIRAKILNRVNVLDGQLPKELFRKLLQLLNDLPEDPHMIHGDFHIKNIMYQDGEALLIDMDSLSHGHPIFELAAMYSAYCGYPDADHEVSKDFLGIDYETGVAFWHRSLAAYLGTEDSEKIRETEAKAAVISFSRIMSRSLRHRKWMEEAGRREIEHCRKRLEELLPGVSTLTF